MGDRIRPPKARTRKIFLNIFGKAPARRPAQVYAQTARGGIIRRMPSCKERKVKRGRKQELRHRQPNLLSKIKREDQKRRDWAGILPREKGP